MNSDHIGMALSIPFFKNHFMGFLFTDSLKLRKRVHKFLDFYVVNTDHIFGRHWFACIYIKHYWIIFDCSEFTPLKDHQALKKILRNEGNVITDQRQLQNPTSLSCGLHVISFFYYIFIIFDYSKDYDQRTYCNDYYCNKLLSFCAMKRITPDFFVYHLVYESRIFHVEKEDPEELRKWFENFQ